MNYKALMLDVDGTLIPYEYTALPSDKVVESISKIKDKIHVCLVTGRSLKSTRHILKRLDLTNGFAVVDGGGYIYDIKKGKCLYERFLTNDDIGRIVSVLRSTKEDFFIKDDSSRKSKDRDYKPFREGDSTSKVTMVFTDEVFTLPETQKILKRLSSPTINVFRTHHKTPNKFGLNITHLEATKMHGVAFLSQKLGLKREEIIGVGDSYNDFPLLMASGLKVAMGNAIEDLKGIADYIAPSVADDGVSDVIDKFLIN